MPKFTLPANAPTAIDVRYCDVVAGEHGPDIRFKGKLAESGQDVVLYFTHDVAFDALAQGKVLGPLPEYDPTALPPKGQSLKLKTPRLLFLLAIPEGQRKGQLRITAREAPAVAENEDGSPADPEWLSDYELALDLAFTRGKPMYEARGVVLGTEQLMTLTNTFFIQLRRER